MYTFLKKCRRWTERIAAEYGFRSDLGGLCGVGACRVFKALKYLDYSPVLVASSDHIFVVAEGNIIDITATQFNLPEIHIEPFPSSLWFYLESNRFKTITELCQQQERDGWDAAQIYWNHTKSF